MHRSFLLASLLVLPTLAGCLAGDDADDGPERPAFDASIVPPTVDWWEDYSTRWAKRDAYTPQSDEALAYLDGDLQDAGYETRLLTYEAREQGVDLPEAGPVSVHALEATLPGGQSDRRLGLVTHMDTNIATFQGAYDNGAGTAATMALCKELAALAHDWQYTLTCLFFDGEERGLVASDRYVQQEVVEGDMDYAFAIGYDMTGINWPGHDWKMYLMTGGEDYVPVLGDFARTLMHDDLGYPPEGVEVLDVHDRNSDERRFREAGIPIFRLAGGRNAADYPQYHMPDDTVEYVYQFVDGRENFEAGMQTILEASHHLALELDGTDWPTILEHYG